MDACKTYMYKILINRGIPKQVKRNKKTIAGEEIFLGLLQRKW